MGNTRPSAICSAARTSSRGRWPSRRNARRSGRANDAAVVKKLEPDEAAALVRPSDTLGIPLGPAQPPAFLEALGRRTDWEELRIYGALLTVLSDVFSHPNVHYLSGFYGPLERMLRDGDANIGFSPADFRRFIPLLEEQAPRVMCT